MEHFFLNLMNTIKNNDLPPFLEISLRWISVDFGHGILWNLTPRWWKSQFGSIFRQVKTYFYPSIHTWLKCDQVFFLSGMFLFCWIAPNISIHTSFQCPTRFQYKFHCATHLVGALALNALDIEVVEVLLHPRGHLGRQHKQATRCEGQHSVLRLVALYLVSRKKKIYMGKIFLLNKKIYISLIRKKKLSLFSLYLDNNNKFIEKWQIQ